MPNKSLGHGKVDQHATRKRRALPKRLLTVRHRNTGHLTVWFVPPPPGWKDRFRPTRRRPHQKAHPHAAAADADALGKQRFHSKGVQKPDPRRLHPPNKHDNTQHRTGARRSLPPWRRCRRPTTVPYSQRAPSLRHSPPRVYDVFDLFEFGSHGADMTQQAEIEGSPEDLGWLNPFGSNLAEAHHHHHYQQQQQLDFQLGDDAMHFRSAQWPLSPASDEGVA